MAAQKVLITGASGFVGSRLCEVLSLGRYDYDITGLVHNIGHAARIGRLPIKIIHGDITDKHFATKLIGDYDIIVHLALGGRRGIVTGTKYLAEAAARRNVNRFIHMSSAAVAAKGGLTFEAEEVTESAGLNKTGNDYADAKIQAERVINRQIKAGLSAVILRPGIIFGPYSFWVRRILTEAEKNLLSLVDDGRGICNTIYIDNLVYAVLLSIANKRASGETFFVRDKETVSWGDFKRAFSSLGTENVNIRNVESKEYLRAVGRQQNGFYRNVVGMQQCLTSPQLRQALTKIPIMKALLAGFLEKYYALPETKKWALKAKLGMSNIENYRPGGETYGTLSTDDVLRERSRGRLSIEKARRLLEYDPPITFRDGVRFTTEWIVNGLLK